MKRLVSSFVRRFLKDERGQSAVVLMVSISATMGLAGMSIETSHVYYAYRLLQASTNAAALAGAYQMPGGNVSGAVNQYSAKTGELNATHMLTSVSISSAQKCLSTVTTDLNVDCVNSSGGTSGGVNALVVTQTATVPLWFGSLVGFKSLNIEAVATAAMKGGANTPWNIAIIQDTTNSMTTSDGGNQCNGTRITCSLKGIQALLNDLYPCGLGQTCSNSGVAPVDSVSLFVFPAVVSTTASKDYVCNTSNPTIVAYTFPNVSTAYTGGAPGTNFQLPSGDTYQILGFQNNYKTTDTATSLLQSSGIVIAAGDSGKSGCTGLQAPGGEGTYYAQAIYAAQEALAAQQTNNPGSKNAMIILSDGNATACASNANTTDGACNTKAQIVATEGTLNGTGTKTTNAKGYENYTYPSALGECGQAVLAAQYAATQGTAVYTIGYGSPTQGGNASSNPGCVSDKKYSTTVTTNGGSWAPGDSPCQAIAAMASAQVNFYSDDGAGCQATAPDNQGFTSLTSIFIRITNSLTIARLIPNGSS